jgi:DNA-directed RNA polymerase specialized sigma24 family protein
VEETDEDLTNLPGEMPRHRLLREITRHYLELEDLCVHTGRYEFEHRGMKFNFLDLQNAFRSLSPRKKEAMFWNVVYDKKQIEVAKIMGITTVSVGQYVESACLQVAKVVFSELPDPEA